LFANLFGFRLVYPADDGTELLGNFMLAWAAFEKSISNAASLIKLTDHDSIWDSLWLPRKVGAGVEGFLSNAEVEEISRLRIIRNEVVHGVRNHNEILKPEMVDRLKVITKEMERRLLDLKKKHSIE